jgi:hypothetical protein
VLGDGCKLWLSWLSNFLHHLFRLTSLLLGSVFSSASCSCSDRTSMQTNLQEILQKLIGRFAVTTKLSIPIQQVLSSNFGADTDRPGRCDSADILVLKLRCNKRSGHRKTDPSPRPRVGPTPKHAHVYDRAKNLVIDLDETWSQEWLCWRGPAAT